MGVAKRLKEEIAAALRDEGCSVYEMDSIADLLIGCRGKTILMRVQASRQPLGQRQLMMAQRGREEGWRGGLIVTAGSAEEATEIVWRVA